MPVIEKQVCQESFTPEGAFKDTWRMIAVEQDEEVSILQLDSSGCGWTYVRAKKGDGFVPTSLFTSYSVVWKDRSRPKKSTGFEGKTQFQGQPTRPGFLNFSAPWIVTKKWPGYRHAKFRMPRVESSSQIFLHAALVIVLFIH